MLLSALRSPVLYQEPWTGRLSPHDRLAAPRESHDCSPFARSVGSHELTICFDSDCSDRRYTLLYVTQSNPSLAQSTMS